MRAESPCPHRWRLLAQVAIPILFAAIALPLIGQIYLAVFEPAPGQNAAAAVAAYVIGAVPSFILAWALLGLAKVFGEYAQGNYLSLTASVNLKRVGQGAVLALLLHYFVAPLLIAAITGAPLWEALNIEPFNLCMLIFAAGLVTVGSLLENAATALKADNDQIV